MPSTQASVTFPFIITSQPSYREVVEHIIRDREAIEAAQDRIYIREKKEDTDTQRNNLNEIAHLYDV